jgi:hypothetical protein
LSFSAFLFLSHFLIEELHFVFQVTLCKDGQGKVGLRVRSINKGVFVCLVTKGSPAAQGGLRFGDQILQVCSSLPPNCFKVAHACCLSLDQF